MLRRWLIPFVCIPLLISFFPASAQERPALQGDDAQATWREDLQAMVERMIDVHPNLFWRISEEDYRLQVADLDADIPYLTDEQIVMGFARMAAYGGGHTYLWLLQDAIGFHLYPLRLYWFSDGLYVLDALDESLVGARVVGIGNASIETAYEQVIPLIWNDNDMAYLLWSPLYFIMPEVLHGLGMVDDVAAPGYVLERDGEQVIYHPEAMTVSDYRAWLDGWYVGYPQAPAPLYLTRHANENFWYTLLDDSQTLYIQYNQVRRSTQSGMSIREFSQAIADVVATGNVARVVLDLRHNGGGDNTTYRPFLRVLSDPAINQPGKLFVITGRYTFSAAMNLSNDLEQNTEALFVGEPTGSRPNFYGDALTFTLPNSGWMIYVSHRYWGDSTPDDTRAWITPDIPVELSSEDYFAGRDPVMEAILAY